MSPLVPRGAATAAGSGTGNQLKPEAGEQIRFVETTGGVIVDSDSAIANVLEILVPVIALAVLATPVLISGLKGRW